MGIESVDAQEEEEGISGELGSYTSGWGACLKKLGGGAPYLS